MAATPTRPIDDVGRGTADATGPDRATQLTDIFVNAVDQVLKAGFRTRDIADATTPANLILGTGEMGQQLLSKL